MFGGAPAARDRQASAGLLGLSQPDQVSGFGSTAEVDAEDPARHASSVQDGSEQFQRANGGCLAHRLAVAVELLALDLRLATAPRHSQIN